MQWYVLICVILRDQNSAARILVKVRKHKRITPITLITASLSLSGLNSRSPSSHTRVLIARLLPKVLMVLIIVSNVFFCSDRLLILHNDPPHLQNTQWVWFLLHTSELFTPIYNKNCKLISHKTPVQTGTTFYSSHLIPSEHCMIMNKIHIYF